MGRFQWSAIVQPSFIFVALVSCICIEASIVGNTSLKARAIATPKDKAVKLPSVPSSNQFAALQKGWAPTVFPWARPPGEPESESAPKYFLTRKQLASVDTIDCLQQKQLEPNKPCHPETKGVVGPFNIGHYPNWKDPACRSNFEYFCDPDSLLPDGKELTMIQNRLQDFQETNSVDCKQFKAIMDPDIERTWYQKKSAIYQGRMGIEDYRQFNLAIVLADRWPNSEMDPKSLQYFGRIVMSEWGLTPIYNGVDAGNSVSQTEMFSQEDYRSNCPNSAMLIILPRYHEAFLSSPSCEFICQSRGGPEVIAEVLAGLDRGGLAEAIGAGVKEIERVLKETIPLSLQKVPVKTLNKDSVSLGALKSDATWVGCLRFLYVLIIALAVFSAIACVYYVVLHEKVENRRALTADYRDVRETMINNVRMQLQQQANAKSQAATYDRARTIAIR